MKRLIRKIIPNKFVNYGKHLPTAVLANVQHGFPSRNLKIIGVTGTDGKTTTTNMIYQILKDAGKSVSMISTINAFIGDKSYDTGFHVTSPNPQDIQRMIKQAREKGSEFMVLEVTSHGLDQFRFWGIKFYVGVITNITHEHLDYHKTFENYLNTKARLIKNVRLAVLNKDDKNFKTLKKKTGGKVLSFGLGKDADFSPHNFSLKLKMPGQYNMLNALAASVAANYLGISKTDIQKSLSNFSSLPGRLQEVKNNKGIKIIIDFAHTPNALENALKTLKPLTSGKLISVFGCASERDEGKRVPMGRISSQFADITVLTDEDPRFENSLKIINEIAEGGRNKYTEGKNLFKEPDRAKAIKLAISLANKGDTVGIFGKGHEQSMNYRGKELPWSDKKAVLEALK